MNSPTFPEVPKVAVIGATAIGTTNGGTSG